MSHSLIEIAQSWYLLASMPEISELANKRLAKCDGCEFKGQINPVGKMLVMAVNDKANTFFCRSCGCPLAALTIRGENQCPEGYWKAEHAGYY